MHPSPGLRVITSNGTLVSLLCENSPTTLPSTTSLGESSSATSPSATSSQVCPEQGVEDNKRHLSWVDSPATSISVDQFLPHVTSRPRSSTCSDILVSDTTTDIPPRKTTSCPTSPCMSSTEPLGDGSKRKYQCSFTNCSKTFTTSGHLARHNRIHTKEKNYSCLMAGCTSKFSRKDNMMQHYRTHTTVKLRRSGYDTAVAVSPQGNSYGVRRTDFTHIQPCTAYSAKNHPYVHLNAVSNNYSPPSKIPTQNPNHSLRLPPPNNLCPMHYPRSTFFTCPPPNDNLFTHRLPSSNFPIPYKIPTYPRVHTGPPGLAIAPMHLLSDQDARTSFATETTPPYPQDCEVSFDRYDMEREVHPHTSMKPGLEMSEEKNSRNGETVDRLPHEDHAPSENPTRLHQLADLAHIVTAFC